MDSYLFNWILDVVNEIAKFGTWLLQPLPTLNMSPLSLFTFTGVGILLGFHLIRLVIGG